MSDLDRAVDRAIADENRRHEAAYGPAELASDEALARRVWEALGLCPTCGCIHWKPCSAPHGHTSEGCPDDGLDCHPPLGDDATA